MTPYQLNICLEGYEENTIDDYNLKMYVMWHNAMIPLFEKKPDLKQFIYSENQVQDSIEKRIINEKEFKAALGAYQKRRDKEKVKDGNTCEANSIP
jgi:hypothetical protein